MEKLELYSKLLTVYNLSSFLKGASDNLTTGNLSHHLPVIKKSSSQIYEIMDEIEKELELYDAVYGDKKDTNS